MISHILFDLDNTLYPASSGLEDAVVRRMTEFVASHLGMDFEEARRIRSQRFKIYGTTLEWLRREHGPVDIDAFFAFTHPEGEEDMLAPDSALRELLAADSRPKSIFTNSPSEHAVRVLKKLGIEDQFEAIYDIRFCGFKGKPAEEAFRLILQSIGKEAHAVAFFDDSPRAVRAFLEMGGRAFLIDENGGHAGKGLPSLSSVRQYQMALRDGESLSCRDRQ